MPAWVAVAATLVVTPTGRGAPGVQPGTTMTFVCGTTGATVTTWSMVPVTVPDVHLSWIVYVPVVCGQTVVVAVTTWVVTLPMGQTDCFSGGHDVMVYVVSVVKVMVLLEITSGGEVIPGLDELVVEPLPGAAADVDDEL